MAEYPTDEGTSTIVSALSRWLPGLRIVREYRRGYLRHDLAAGLAVTALLVPQGMAYAQLAGLPAVTGLYTTVIALLAYALFGPSRTLVLGPDSALAPLILAAILPLVGAGGDPARAVALASALAIIMGAICMVVGLAHIGILTELLSKPLRVGYLNGIAIVIIVSQLPKLFGFSSDVESTPARLHEFLLGVIDGRTNATALVIGVVCLAVAVALKELAPKLPGVLFAVVGATVAVATLDLAAKGVAVVGPVPRGFPVPALPTFDFADLSRLFLAALGMAFVTLADTSPLSRSLALKHGQAVDQDREIVAIGAANLTAGLFQGFPVSASLTRTAVAETTGAKSQAVGLIGAVSVLCLLLFASELTANLPQASLAAIVIFAGLALFDLAVMRWLWCVRRSELVLCVAAIAGVVVVGVLPGIVIAIGLSIAAFMHRMWRPYDATLGRVPGRHGYHDVVRHPEARQAPGLMIFRFDAPIFFANAEHFARAVRKHIAERGEPVRRVIIAGEPITDIDTTGAEVLRDLIDDLAATGVDLAFAELKGPVKDRLRRYGIFERIGAENFFSTIGHAVHAYRDEIAEEAETGNERDATGSDPENPSGPSV